MKVELISETQYLGDRFSTSNLSGEELIIAIARESTNRPLEERVKDCSKLINYLIKNSHWSPFEMVDLTFYLETSIPISKQLIRHRSFNFQELSRRYTDNDIDFEPVELREKSMNKQTSSDKKVYNSEVLERELYFYQQSTFNFYRKLLEHGVAPESARFVLPQSTTTRMYMKGSIRSWLTFLLQRLSPHAQKEIRLLANEIKEILKLKYPNIIKTFLESNGIK